MIALHKKSLIITLLACCGLLIACNLPVQNDPSPTLIIPTTGLPQAVPPSATVDPTATDEEAAIAEEPLETATAAEQPQYLPNVVEDEKPAPMFGVSVSPLSDEGGMTIIKDANTVWTRYVIDWNTVERSRGVWDWNDPEFLLRESQLRTASELGYKTVVVLGATPQWAVKDGFKCGAVREDAFGDFITYAKEVVTRYSASPYNVEYYEIYNEPDAPDFLGCWGDVNDSDYFGGYYYGLFLKAIYAEVKAANPSAQLLVGGLLLGCNPNLGLVSNGAPLFCTPARFLEGILESGAKDAFDGVAFHAYDYFFLDPATGEEWYANPHWASSWDTTGPVTLAKAKYVRDFLSQYGAHDKVLLNTEIGLLCGSGDTGTCSNPLRKSPFKTYYVIYSFVTSIADDYEAVIWFSSMGDNRGNELLNPDLSPTPAFNAYKFMTSTLIDASYLGQLSIGSGVTGYEFDEAGTRIWVVWATDWQKHTLSLPRMPSAVYQIGLDGHGASLPAAQNLEVTIAPVFILFP